MKRSNNRRFCAKRFARAFKFTLAGLALALPGVAMAQVYVCASDIAMDAVGEEPFFINEPISIELTLTAGTVTKTELGVTEPGVLRVTEFDYKPDCELGSDFASCTAAGNTVAIVTGDAEIGGTCGADFTTSTSDGGVTYQFLPAEPIQLDSLESCTVTFDIMVVGVEPGTTGILETSGWAESQAACFETDGTPYGLGTAASASLFFPLSTERAVFRVTKDFVDDSDGEVEVFLRCNAGIPLEQSFMLGDDDWVSFVVREFRAGEMDCSVWEEPVPDGYTAGYVAGGTGSAALIDADENGCVFEGVQAGDFTCDVTNAVDEVEIEVTKQWVGVTEQDMALEAEAAYSCFNVYASPDGGQTTTVSGTLSFSGQVDTQTIGGLYPAASGSYCTVTEPVLDEFVEVDASDCANVPVEPGANCTLVNSVFFEGIPTLSQWGMAIMALLMLGMGLVGFRRFV